MDKMILEKYKNQDEKLLLSKIIDKSKFCETRNKIEVSQFLDMSQKKLVTQFLKSQKISNYIFYGGFNQAERVCLIFYPEKIESIVKTGKINFNSIFNVIRIILPNETKGEYTHKNYLGAIIKLGINRQKVGDILVDEDGADIIIQPEICKFLLDNLPSLTRFSKANIEKIELEELKRIQIEKEEITITVPSMRLDNIVSELARCSRSKANELILQERVLVNFTTIIKNSKEIKEKDLITIRGKGRFEIIEVTGNTKKGRCLLKVEKFKN